MHGIQLLIVTLQCFVSQSNNGLFLSASVDIIIPSVTSVEALMLLLLINRKQKGIPGHTRCKKFALSRKLHS